MTPDVDRPTTARGGDGGPGEEPGHALTSERPVAIDAEVTRVEASPVPDVTPESGRRQPFLSIVWPTAAITAAMRWRRGLVTGRLT